MTTRTAFTALTFFSFLAFPLLGQPAYQTHNLEHNLLFPVMVMGGPSGFAPRLFLFNSELSGSVAGNVYLFGQDGRPLKVYQNPDDPASLANQLKVYLSPAGARSFDVYLENPSLTVGWALFEVTAPTDPDLKERVIGSVLTGYLKGDGTTGSVGVVAGSYQPGKHKRISIPVSVSGSMNTGVALVNAGSQPLTITWELRDSSGALVAATPTNAAQISPLAPGHQVSLFVTEMFPALGSSNQPFDGSLVIKTDQEGLEAIGLLDVDGTLTSIPTIHLAEGSELAWTAVNTGLTDLGITALAPDPAHPDTIYAATENRGPFKSTNGGANWFPTGLDNLGVNLLAVDPGDSNTVYAGTRGNGVFKSTDGGKSWTKLDVDVPFVDLLMTDPSSPGTLFVSHFGGFVVPSVLYKSTDRGTSWASIKLPQSEFLAIAPSNSDFMYTTYSGQDDFSSLYKSTNGGAAFGRIATCCHDIGYISRIAVDPSNPNTLYGEGTGNPALRSTDGGTTWIRTDVPIATLARDDGGILYGVGSGFVYRSTDQGVTWTPFIQGLIGKSVRTIVVSRSNPTTLYVGTSANGIFKYGP